ncbi:MAG TPA: class B sortase [Ruminococcaceae bacterium]|nr:class B sortase [Oscillospiraceae bacterium]
MRKVRRSRRKRWFEEPCVIFSRPVWFVLLMFCCSTFILSATMLIWGYTQGEKEEASLKELAAVVADSIVSPAPVVTIPSGMSEPLPTSQEPVLLEQYRALYEQNADIVGWIKTDGTEIDYPVMYTGDDFYLSHDFDKAESKSGVPFIDKRCIVEPFGTNTIIYGHHMKKGTMFAGLEGYEDEGFYKKQPTIRFDTLYEQQEYDIIAVFKSQIYRKSNTVFKHYNFLNSESWAEFDDYIANIKALSLYDTGVTAEYGDELITLSTCAYHTVNGQFVVVAKK